MYVPTETMGYVSVECEASVFKWQNTWF